MIRRPVRYGWGHSPHDEGAEFTSDIYDPLGVWGDEEEITGQWQQSAAPDLTPRTDD